MASLTKVNYVKGVVICHGKSELLLTRYITSNLHLNVKPYSKDNGTHSIQIAGLMSVLNSKPFKSQKYFLEEYPVEVIGKGRCKKLLNFKLFVIMDTDDCTEQEKKAFISGSMFSGHWLSEYIVPIYNVESFEDVMTDARITAKRVRDDEKGTVYSKIFPINNKPLSDDTLSEVKTFRGKIMKSNKTNLLEFVDYCLSLLS